MKRCDTFILIISIALFVIYVMNYGGYVAYETTLYIIIIACIFKLLIHKNIKD